jgi:SNF2 family DNA or RNA helicase
MAPPWLKRSRSSGSGKKKRPSKKAKKAPAKDVKDEPFVVPRPEQRLASRAEVERRLASVPPRLSKALYPFQSQGLHFCVERGARVLIGDEMGLGKTIQAIATACAYREAWPVLVVVPAVVKLNWAEEIERWVDELEPGEIHVVRGMKDVDAWSAARGVKWVIVTYGLFRNSSAVALRIKEAAFDFVIVDESHYLKSHDAIRTTLIGPIVRDAQHALLLSGTPALARPAELYPQVAALRANAFGSWSQFTKFFCNAKRGRFGWDTKGASNLDELSARLKPMMLRRKKAEVLTELPPKVKRRIAIDLAPKAAKEIAASMETLRKVGALARFLDDGGAGAASASDRDARSARNEHLGLLTQTFQATGLAKIPGVKEYLTSFLLGSSAETKVIVFAHHRAVLDGVEAALAAYSTGKSGKQRLDWMRIDGDTPHSERTSNTHKFQNDAQ